LVVWISSRLWALVLKPVISALTMWCIFQSHLNRFFFFFFVSRRHSYVDNSKRDRGRNYYVDLASMIIIVRDIYNAFAGAETTAVCAIDDAIAKGARSRSWHVAAWWCVGSIVISADARNHWRIICRRCLADSLNNFVGTQHGATCCPFYMAVEMGLLKSSHG